MYKNIKEDVRIFSEKHRDQGFFKYFYYPDIRVVFLIRFSQWLYRVRWLRPLSYIIVNLNDFLHGVWVGPRVSIGRGLSLGHPRGLVINPGTEIGCYCTIINGVTIGGNHVKIGDFVEIGAGAAVISSASNHVDIGAHVIIGAGAVVTKSAAPFSVLAGVPARKIKSKELNSWLELHPYYLNVVGANE